MIFEYPYTDSHELNLDWFLKEFKELVDTWEQVQSDWNSLHDYVQNYFDNLNVQAEINNKIDAMIADGTFALVVTPLVEAALPTIVDGKLPAVVASQIGQVVASQIGAVVAGQLPAVAAQAAADEVSDWLAAHVDPATGYVIDTSLTVSNAAADAKITGDRIAEKLSKVITNDFTDASKYDANHYVRYDGVYGSSSGYAISDPVFVIKGSNIVVNGRGYQTDTAIISVYDPINNTYTPKVVSIDSTIREYTWTATESCYIVVSLNYNAATHILKVDYNDTDKLLNEIISEINQYDTEIDEVKEDISKINLDYTKIFRFMAGLGDSLMSGEIYNTDESLVKDCYNYSWLSYLSKYNDAKWECFSKGGLTTWSWISSHWKTDFEALENLPDCVYIAFGTNDKNHNEVPMGTYTDSTTTESFAGYYKSIINIVHTKCPGAKIFLCSLYDDSDTKSVDYSNLISQIASLYSYCYYIDIIDNYTISRKAIDSIYAESSHFSTLGYFVTAELIHRLTYNMIANNLADYKYLGLDNTI